MKPIEFTEMNTVFRAPNCDDLPACVQQNEEFKSSEVISCWELTDDDCVNILKQIKEGIRPSIYLSIIGGQPPVALFLREDSKSE